MFSAVVAQVKQVDPMTLGWLIAGVVLMLSELVIPGMVAIFLGLAALLVALCRWMGWVESLSGSVLLWSVASLGLIVSLRGFVERILPGDRHRDPSTDEDQAVVNEEVDVVEVSDKDPRSGRIRFRGTTWTAHSNREPLVVGQKARIVGRQNLDWLVEPTTGNDSPTNGNSKSDSLDVT